MSKQRFNRPVKVFEIGRSVDLSRRAGKPQIPEDFFGANFSLTARIYVYLPLGDCISHFSLCGPGSLFL